MNSAGNILKNNNLAALQRQAGPEILGAIRKASARTGVDFAYLVEKASAESSFKTDIKSKTSSATGLYQFIEKTWIGMIREHGDKYGLGEYAAKIDAKGKVADAAIRKEILDLRKDPETAAAMAAEYAADNKRYLEKQIDGDVGSVELYLAHFMGPSGAAGFLKAMENNPVDNAAALFPKAARANYNVFYDAKSGEPRTLAGVYDFFAKKFGSDQTGKAPIVSAAKTQSPTTTKTNNVADKSEWVASLFQDHQKQQIRLLAGSDNDDQIAARRTAPPARLGAIGSGTASLVTSPLQIMEMAQLDTPRESNRIKTRYSYND